MLWATSATSATGAGGRRASAGASPNCRSRSISATGAARRASTGSARGFAARKARTAAALARHEHEHLAERCVAASGHTLARDAPAAPTRAAGRLSGGTSTSRHARLHRLHQERRRLLGRDHDGFRCPGCVWFSRAIASRPRMSRESVCVEDQHARAAAVDQRGQGARLAGGGEHVQLRVGGTPPSCATRSAPSAVEETTLTFMVWCARPSLARGIGDAARNVLCMLFARPASVVKRSASAPTSGTNGDGGLDR